MIIIPNAYIKKISEKICDANIDDIIEYVKNPTEFTRKEDLPAVVFAEFDNEEKGRTLNNLAKITKDWIGLDFDHASSITDWMLRYHKYRYILYTTWNHGKDDEDHFRVFLNVTGINLSELGDTFDKQHKNWKFTISDTFSNLDDLNINVDKNAVDWSRLFYLPSKRPGYFFHINEGVPFKLTMMQEPEIIYKHAPFANTFLSKYSEKCVYNVENNPKVQHYLSTSYTKIKGNGDGEKSFMTAVAVCVGAKDTDTLEKVCAKARRERWKESDIQRKIDAAQKFIGR